MGRGIGIRFELGAVVVTEYEAGFVQCQPDGAGKKPRQETFEAHHPGGFGYRPQDPTQDQHGTIQQGATVLVGTAGNDKFVVFLNDPRVVDALPELEKGSSVQYAHRLSGTRSFDHHDGATGTKRIVVDYGSGTHEIVIPGDGSEITINGCKITASGDVITPEGVSLRNHVHNTAMGPTGAPLPTP